MQKILIITPQVIIPPIDGGGKCIHSHVDMFSISNSVSIVMGNSDDRNQDMVLSQQYLRKCKEVIIFSRINKKIKKSGWLFKGLEGLKWFLSGKPRQAQTIESNENKNLVTEYAIKNKIDTIYLETPYAAELINIERIKKNGIKLITIEHNVEFLFLKDCLAKFGKFAWLELRRAKQYEQYIVNHSDLVIGISPLDVTILKNEFNIENIRYVPTYLEKKNVFWRNNESNYIIFSGTLSFYPNYHGIKWFLKNVFIKYADQYPNICLKITGRVDRKIQEEFSKYLNVEFTGFLSNKDLEKMFVNALFSVVPIIKGSGIKMKLLEALSYGIPTITTVHGAQGVPYEGNIPYLIGANEMDFLSHMIALTKNKNVRKNLGNSGKIFFEKIYASEENINTWTKCLEKKKSLYT
jgi:glycosyltransferase involved in cell wall biosynthesis